MSAKHLWRIHPENLSTTLSAKSSSPTSCHVCSVPQNEASEDALNAKALLKRVKLTEG